MIFQAKLSHPMPASPSLNRSPAVIVIMMYLNQFFCNFSILDLKSCSLIYLEFSVLGQKKSDSKPTSYPDGMEYPQWGQ
jgi:hypothetical protein